MGAEESGHASSRAGLRAAVRPTSDQVQQKTRGVNDHLNAATEEEVAGGHGLIHHGEPEEEDVIAMDQPEKEAVVQPRVVRTPRVPTQNYIDAHVATHLPHEAWCEVCMMGRGAIPRTRNALPLGAGALSE